MSSDSRGEREDRDTGRVLARAGKAETDPGERIVAHAPVAHDSGAPQQRERERQERGGVVEREVPIEDGQERDRLERRREQADATVEEASAEQVEQPHGRRAEQGNVDARDEKDLVRMHVVFAGQDVARPEPDHEHEVQHIGERGRVDEVVRVEAMCGHLDSLGHEMTGLVDVVDVGQALPDPPQAQARAPSSTSRAAARPTVASRAERPSRVIRVARPRGTLPGIAGGRGRRAQQLA